MTAPKYTPALAKASTREQWDLEKLAKAIRDAVNRVTKAAGCSWNDLEIDLETPPVRAERIAKAEKAERLARVTSDPVEAAAYRRQAREIREEHQGSTERLAKAREYRDKARRVTDPELRHGYEELARQAAGA